MHIFHLFFSECITSYQSIQPAREILIGLSFLSGRIAVLRRCGRSLTRTIVSPAKTAEPIDMSFETWGGAAAWAGWAMPGGPWPTQIFGWVDLNAFGPINNWPVFSDVFQSNRL